MNRPANCHRHPILPPTEHPVTINSVTRLQNRTLTPCASCVCVYKKAALSPSSTPRPVTDPCPATAFFAHCTLQTVYCTLHTVHSTSHAQHLFSGCEHPCITVVFILSHRPTSTPSPQTQSPGCKAARSRRAPSASAHTKRRRFLPRARPDR